MSTSIATSSGITLVFMPPWTTLGENVVWVQAWANLAVRVSAIDSHAAHARAGSTSAARVSASRSSDAA